MDIPYGFGDVRVTKLPLMADKAVVAASEDVRSHIRTGRSSVLVYNGGTVAVYFGGSDVCADKGVPIAAGAQMIFPTTKETAVYLYSIDANDGVLIAEFFD